MWIFIAMLIFCCGCLLLCFTFKAAFLSVVWTLIYIFFCLLPLISYERLSASCWALSADPCRENFKAAGCGWYWFLAFEYFAWDDADCNTVVADLLDYRLSTVFLDIVSSRKKDYMSQSWF